MKQIESWCSPYSWKNTNSKIVPLLSVLDVKKLIIVQLQSMW